MDNVFSSLLNLFFPQSALEKEAAAIEAADLLSRGKPKGSPHPFIFPLLSYRDPLVRHMVWSLKYKGDVRTASVFGKALADHILSICEDNYDFDEKVRIALVPVPKSKRYDRKHPRPQTRLIVARIAKNNSLFSANTHLKKNRRTPRQTDMKSKTARRRNIAGAFVAKEKLPREPLYVIVDDVTTTGATLSEARRALWEAGAKKIIAVTVAH